MGGRFCFGCEVLVYRTGMNAWSALEAGSPCDSLQLVAYSANRRKLRILNKAGQRWPFVVCGSHVDEATGGRTRTGGAIVVGVRANGMAWWGSADKVLAGETQPVECPFLGKTFAISPAWPCR